MATMKQTLEQAGFTVLAQQYDAGQKRVSASNVFYLVDPKDGRRFLFANACGGSFAWTANANGTLNVADTVDERQPAKTKARVLHLCARAVFDPSSVVPSLIDRRDTEWLRTGVFLPEAE
jgi:hypothetical protein